MIRRREALVSGAALLGGAVLLRQEKAVAAPPQPDPVGTGGPYTPVVMPNGSTLPWKMEEA